MNQQALRVLVVDDSQDSADTVAMLLEAKGYEAAAAYEGRAALELMEREAFDVAILDLQLPGMGGAELAAELRRRGTRPLLIIALTGHAMDDDETELRKKGFDHYLLKPLDVERLVEMLGAFAAS